MQSMPIQTQSTETRVERKRRATRERIIHEAERLMRAGNIENIKIEDITNAADVGHGTFYLHFKSKYEVLIEITRSRAEEWDKTLQDATKDIDDPAEVVGHSARFMGRALIADPLWGWMLKHSGMPIEDIRNAIGQFAERDFRRGLKTGRFRVNDLRTANSFIVGGFVTCLLMSTDLPNPNQTIDHMVGLLLIVLGIETEDAARISSQQIPFLSLLHDSK